MDILAIAFWVAVAILVIAAVVRVIRRDRSHDLPGGAATSRTSVPAGSGGIARTALAPTGVVYAGGEEWSARSGSGHEIASGAQIRVVGQEGLTLIVEPEPSGGSTGT